MQSKHKKGKCKNRKSLAAVAVGNTLRIKMNGHLLGQTAPQSNTRNYGYKRCKRSEDY